MATRDDDTRAFVRRVFEATTPQISSGFRRQVAEDREQGRRASAPRWRTGLRSAGLGAVGIAAVVLVALLFVTLVHPRLPPTTSPAESPSTVPGTVFRVFGDPSPNQTGVLAQATSTGYTVQVVRAYNDGNVLLLQFAVQPASTSATPFTYAFPDAGYVAQTPPKPMVVRDGSGAVLPGNGSLVTEPWETPAQFAELQSVFLYQRQDGQPVDGSSISVQIGSVELIGDQVQGPPEQVNGQSDRGALGNETIVDGHWNLSFPAPVQGSTRTIATPSSLHAASTTATFTKAVLGGNHYLELNWLCSDTAPRKNTVACGGVSVYGPDGDLPAMLASGPSWGYPTVAMSSFIELESVPGTYTILFEGGDPMSATAQTTISVPVGNPSPVFLPQSAPPLPPGSIPSAIPTIAPRLTPSPTSPAAPTPTPSPAGSADLPACTASQLSVILRGGGVASGNIAQVVVLTNTSRSSCTLNGYPDVTLLDGGGNPVFSVTRHTGMLVDPTVHPRPVTLAADGGTASFTIGMLADTNYCSEASRVRVTLPGSDAALTIDGSVYYCPANRANEDPYDSPIVPGPNGATP